MNDEGQGLERSQPRGQSYVFQKHGSGRVSILIACAGVLEAQTYYDRQGTTVQGVAPIPYDYWPVGPGQHNLAPSSSTPLTIPPGARYATACSSTGTVRYTTDGLTPPTSTTGQPLFSGSCTTLSGVRVLSNFRAVSGGRVLDVEYFQ